MPDITITDSIHATADIEFSDTSSLSLAKLSSLNFSSLPVVGDFAKPVDQCSWTHAEFGLTFATPSLLLSEETTLDVQGAATGSLSIRNAASGTLFEEDEFTPEIPIQAGECWIGLDVQLDLSAKAGATFNGFGVAAEGISRVDTGTYVRFKAGSNGLPLLRDALKAVFERYSPARTSAALLAQDVGIAYTLGTGGAIKLSGSYSLPISVNPLASAGLPFNYTISLDADVTVRVGGEVKLSGEFIVRSYKASKTELILGVYKKKETMLAATFEAGAGIRADIGETDVVAAFLGALFPAVDPVAAGFTQAQSAAFQAALQDCIDSSLSLAVNASCAATNSDESAIVYSIDLTNGDTAKTASAIDAALHGDWTLLTFLPNAEMQRNICREMHRRKHTIAVNLLGFYNAGAVTDYIKSSTVLHDATGQVVLIDEVSAKHMAVASAPYLADKDKLRAALAEGFIATVTYGASASGAVQLKNFAVQQNYVNYKAQMRGHDLRSQLLLGRALRLSPEGLEDSIPDNGVQFQHVKTWVNAVYDTDSTLKLFFSDPVARTPYTRGQLERVGRDAKLALLSEPGPRKTALQSDAIWNALNDTGNVAMFNTIPELSHCNAVDLSAIGADWYDIVWWADAMLAVAPALARVLQTPGTAGAKHRKALEDALAKAAANARSAFGDGWGLLTMFLLSGGAPTLDMEIGWNGKFLHYPAAAKVAAAGA